MQPRPGHRLSPAVWLPLLALLAPCLLRAQEAPVSPPCTLRETDRWPARLDDGSHVYVEPTDLTTWSGRSLLAGTPTYVVAPGQAGPDAANVRNSIAGIMLGPGRRTTVVPWPVERDNLRVLRSAVRPDGGWLVLVGEMDGPVGPPGQGGLAGLWYGEWSGDAWTHVEAVPLPRPGVRLANPSSVAWLSDGFAWALPFQDGEERGAVVLRRSQSAWTWDVIPANHGLYVELWSRGDSLRAALVHPDRSQRRDSNSLFLYEPSAGWRATRRLVLGGNAGVHMPRVVTTSGGPVLSWRRFVDGAWRLEALVGVDADSVVTVDPDIASFSVLATADDHALWTLAHAEADTIAATRFYRERNGIPVPLGSIAPVYTGAFEATPESRNGLLVAGPRFSTDPAELTLVTLALRIAVDCIDP